MFDAWIEVDRIPRLEDILLGSDLRFDTPILDQKHDLAAEAPCVRSHATGSAARLESNTPYIESVARNHSNEMFHLGFAIHHQALSIVSAQNRDLLVGVDLGEQFTRTTVETIRDLEQHRDGGNRL